MWSEKHSEVNQEKVLHTVVSMRIDEVIGEMWTYITTWSGGEKDKFMVWGLNADN